MIDIKQQQLIVELSREIVLSVAPEELPLFRVQSDVYFKNQRGQTPLISYIKYS